MKQVVIVGSGPAGLAAASHCAANGVDYVVLERAAHLADTVDAYQARKFVMDEPALIPLRGELPLQAGSRESILAAWRKHVEERQLKIRYGCGVRSIEKNEGHFEIATTSGDLFQSRKVILAVGTQGNPRKLDVPGEQLPHVKYRLADPAEHNDKDIVVVGAGDSALEVALSLCALNRVSLVVRGPEIARANERLTKEILAQQASGELSIYFNTVVKEVTTKFISLNVRGELTRIPANLTILKLGADAPRSFFESMGVRYDSHERDARPILSPAHETSVPGLFLIGAASGRDLIKLGMNQGYEVVEHLLGHEVVPADEDVLKARLPFWSGPVRERIQHLREHIPLLAAADEQQLRETFLAAQVRSYRDGEVIVRQNDYTTEFLLIESGRVAIWQKPEKSKKEVKFAELNQGNFFGEMSLISGRRRNATARAIGATRIIEIPRKAILKLLTTAPRARTLVDQVFLLRAFGGYLFPGIPDNKLAPLVAKARVERVGKGAVMFREGDDADAFYMIRNGMVKVTKESVHKEIVLSYLVAGNFFGEAALISNSARTATVSAIFPTDLIRLDKRDFEEFLALHPELREAPLRKLEERRVAALISEGTAGSGNILDALIREEVVMGTQTLIIDQHRCVRCGNCVTACEGVHDDGQARLSLTGIRLSNVLAPNSCWQCENPMCMLDCPPDAITRDPRGEVYIKSNCIGCGNCEKNCPYDNIFMVEKTPKRTITSWIRSMFDGHDAGEQTVAVKCDLCRGIKGGPACVRSCPTGAAIRLTPEEYSDVLEGVILE
jgi:CRP-like cAMP-binding protein/thioredoxin reductase/Fe-S-cluster-containing hydrogenase component 2